MTAALTEALTAVEANANDEWKIAAMKVVEDLAMTNDTFTTDEVWDELLSREIDTHERRAMGPIMVKAVRDGLCEMESCDTCGTHKVVVLSARPVNHRTDITVYRSLLR